MIDTLILNTAELVLKGGVRRFFEEQLLRNVQSQLLPDTPVQLEWRQAGLYLSWPEPPDIEAVRANAQRLARVFGVAYVGLAASCPLELEKISALAVDLLAGEPAGSFKVDCRRQDKRLPFKSPAVAREVGAAVLMAQPERSVKLNNPDLTLRIILETGQAFLMVNPLPGPAGLPVNTAGRLTALLSGGIDSPVAAWRMASRGCLLELVHFHSYPMVTQASLDKVKRLAARLATWQVADRLVLMPLLDIQKQIVSAAPEADRVLLYRRAMLQLAERVAAGSNSLGLVTGDSVGQVASQTLENLLAVTSAVSLPVYRPLCGNDKESVVQLAKRIDTYDLSIEPHDDCCSLFTPAHPTTRAKPATLQAAEAACDLGPLLETAWEQCELIPLTADWD
jgi:thiamine biosynthesis protein ThiI